MAPPSGAPQPMEKAEHRLASPAAEARPDGPVPVPQSPAARAKVLPAAPAAPATVSTAPRGGEPLVVRTGATADAGPPSAPQVRREIAGWLTAYVTTSISVLTADGRVERRIPREAVKLPQGGLPYYKGPSGDLIVALVGDRELILDAAEFELRPAKPIVKDTCEDLRQRGQVPNRHSPASMGHGNCR